MNGGTSDSDQAGLAVAPASDGLRQSVPRLSVVVLDFGGGLPQCLAALQPQAEVLDAEVIVPHDSTLQDAATLERAFPTVRFVEIPGRRTPAELRATGAVMSSGDVVAFLEGHCRPAPDWCARVLAAHDAPHEAVGGPIEKGLPDNGYDTALNWSVYLADYSRYMLPRPEGVTPSLSDCNVSYKRAALDAIRERWATEFHENVVNSELRAAGAMLWFDPAMAVSEQRRLTVGAALQDRFSFGRLFGSTRVQGMTLPRRVAWAAAALLMPPVLVVRVASNLRRRGRYRKQLLRCLPALTMISAAWMAGEAVGYLTGRAGKALEPSARPSTPVAA